VTVNFSVAESKVPMKYAPPEPPLRMCVGSPCNHKQSVKQRRPKITSNGNPCTYCLWVRKRHKIRARVAAHAFSLALAEVTIYQRPRSVQR